MSGKRATIASSIRFHGGTSTASEALAKVAPEDVVASRELRHRGTRVAMVAELLFAFLRPRMVAMRVAMLDDGQESR